MALAPAPGLRESQLREIVRSGLPPHANLLFFRANRAMREEELPRADWFRLLVRREGLQSAT